MIMPNAIFHYAAYYIINHYMSLPNHVVLVGDCKPATIDTVEDNRTDFTLKVLFDGHLVCYLVFRMTAFAKTDSFDMLSNVKIYGPEYNLLRELLVRDYDNDANMLSQALIRAISSLV